MMRLFNLLKRIPDYFMQSELTRRLLKNTGYLSSSATITAAIGMVQGILTARLLGVENFGVLGTITLFTSVVNKLASFRMGELVVRYVGYYTERRDDTRAAATFKIALIVEFITSIFAFILILLLAPVAAKYLIKDPSTTGLFMVYSLIVPANAITESSTGLLQIFDRFRNLATINILQGIITLTLIFMTFITKGGLTEILLCYLAGKVIGAIGVGITALIIATRHWNFSWLQVPINTLRSKTRELVNFAVNTNISATISLVTKDSEILWVSLFRTPLEAGYYKLALALANMVQLPVSPMPQAIYPEFSRQADRRDWKNMRQIMRQGSILAGGYTLAVTIGLILFGPFIIKYIYTPQYMPAFPALLILLIGFLVSNTFYWRRSALLALGRPDYPAKVNMVLAVIKVALVILLVPKYGYLISAALLSGYYIANSLIFVTKIRSILLIKSSQI